MSWNWCRRRDSNSQISTFGGWHVIQLHHGSGKFRLPATPNGEQSMSRRHAIHMDDGNEFIAGPGDVTSLPSGHDAWVVGEEPVVVVDWFGATSYAK
jgi:hypothetical protein